MASGTVVVTGASSGIGEASVRHLTQLGFEVRAGVRKQEDAERLRSQGVKPLMLDVTDADSIAGARDQLGGRPLAGLVNNAGIAVSSPLEHVPIEGLRDQLEINLIGQIAVTQAFLPGLRAARGRIVMVSSIGGRMALPLTGPYNASKFGLEGASDALRQELRGAVEVILVEPGAVKTPIWGKGSAAADELIASMPPEAERDYSDLIAGLRREVEKIETETGLDPAEVAKVIGQALTARRPHTRYLVGRDAKLRAFMSTVLPDRLLDALVARQLKG
ncbi:MAG TPA: SDR family oxidoreductase [Thermoleophilaceae bacterium]|jgi:NAD(P)-dependent dehydrogenase (short-subunit alcohol dehydrogenase family)